MILDIKMRNIKEGGFVNSSGSATSKDDDGNFYCGREIEQNNKTTKCNIINKQCIDCEKINKQY